LGNNLVVVRGAKQGERRGILLPDTAQEESNTAEVIAIGPDVKYIRVGDTILVPMLTYVRVMQTRTFDLTVSVAGEEKPALVIKEEDVAVVWPQE
jgi:co-chaperonin GroES (HSP10)